MSYPCLPLCCTALFCLSAAGYATGAGIRQIRFYERIGGDSVSPENLKELGDRLGDASA